MKLNALLISAVSCLLIGTTSQASAFIEQKNGWSILQWHQSFVPGQPHDKCSASKTIDNSTWVWLMNRDSGLDGNLDEGLVVLKYFAASLPGLGSANEKYEVKLLLNGNLLSIKSGKPLQLETFIDNGDFSKNETTMAQMDPDGTYTSWSSKNQELNSPENFFKPELGPSRLINGIYITLNRAEVRKIVQEGKELQIEGYSEKLELDKFREIAWLTSQCTLNALKSESRRFYLDMEPADPWRMVFGDDLGPDLTLEQFQAGVREFIEEQSIVAYASGSVEFWPDSKIQESSLSPTTQLVWSGTDSFSEAYGRLSYHNQNFDSQRNRIAIRYSAICKGRDGTLRLDQPLVLQLFNSVVVTQVGLCVGSKNSNGQGRTSWIFSTKSVYDLVVGDALVTNEFLPEANETTAIRLFEDFKAGFRLMSLVAQADSERSPFPYTTSAATVLLDGYRSENSEKTNEGGARCLGAFHAGEKLNQFAGTAMGGKIRDATNKIRAFAVTKYISKPSSDPQFLRHLQEQYLRLNIDSDLHSLRYLDWITHNDIDVTKPSPDNHYVTEVLGCLSAQEELGH